MTTESNKIENREMNKVRVFFLRIKLKNFYQDWLKNREKTNSEYQELKREYHPICYGTKRITSKSHDLFYASTFVNIWMHIPLKIDKMAQ